MTTSVVQCRLHVIKSSSLACQVRADVTFGCTAAEVTSYPDPATVMNGTYVACTCPQASLSADAATVAAATVINCTQQSIETSPSHCAVSGSRPGILYIEGRSRIRSLI